MLDVIVSSALALATGSAIGYAFGLLQAAALRRNEQRQSEGRLKHGWSLMPGAGVRVAYLLLVLLGVQVICPMLFRDGIQWWVSCGVLAGYGWTLLRRILRLRRGAAL